MIVDLASIRCIADSTSTGTDLKIASLLQLTWCDSHSYLSVAAASPSVSFRSKTSLLSHNRMVRITKLVPSERVVWNSESRFDVWSGKLCMIILKRSAQTASAVPPTCVRAAGMHSQTRATDCQRRIKLLAKLKPQNRVQPPPIIIAHVYSRTPRRERTRRFQSGTMEPCWRTPHGPGELPNKGHM